MCWKAFVFQYMPQFSPMYKIKGFFRPIESQMGLWVILLPSLFFKLLKSKNIIYERKLSCRICSVIEYYIFRQLFRSACILFLHIFYILHWEDLQLSLLFLWIGWTVLNFQEDGLFAYFSYINKLNTIMNKCSKHCWRSLTSYFFHSFWSWYFSLHPSVWPS